MAIFLQEPRGNSHTINEDGSINYDRLDELIEFHCAHKTDSIVNLWYNRRVCYHDRRRTHAVCEIHNRPCE